MDDDRPTSYDQPVPDGETFAADREEHLARRARDTDLRAAALALQQQADRHDYTYSWEWLGVPVIRLPDDVMVLQELFWSYRPQRVVETGVARGGSVLLDASLMRLTGVEPAVLGIDIAIYPHTHRALAGHPMSAGVELLEADSASGQAAQAVERFLAGVERALLVLDSNHTHAHVLAELRALAPLLPAGGYVLVADTLIEEMPAGYYPDRPWDRGDNPMTAVQAFLAERADFAVDERWSRRALLTEFRDGVLRRSG